MNTADGKVMLMADAMTFPGTWEEFEKSYGFDDSDEVYTNGSRLIPSFRVKQWLDHIAQFKSKQQATVSSDCITRQAAIDATWEEPSYTDPLNVLTEVRDRIEALPSAQPEQIIRCTNCRFFKRNIPCTGGHYNGCEMWLDDGNEIRVMTDDYCSKALPKEGEQE